jgi:hypothetical protein
MHFNRLSAFTLGVIITAASVGAVTYANAASNGTLKACANKTTGAMRYISKGSCKKTETSLSWNQMGSQGLPGVAGAKGDTGAAGTNGINGSNGTAGTDGSNGQNFYAVDATGKTLGPILGNVGSSVDVLIDNTIWTLDKATTLIQSTTSSGTISYHSNSSCSAPYFSAPSGTAIITQGISFDFGSDQRAQAEDKAYKVSGSQISLTGLTIYRWNYISSSSTVCIAITDSEKSILSLNTALYPVTEVTKPAYTAPLAIVAR